MSKNEHGYIGASGSRAGSLGPLFLLMAMSLSAAGCVAEMGVELEPWQEEDPGDTGVSESPLTCGPRMRVFPVLGAHNIGYDARSCGTGRCATSCPDSNANSDWGGRHHGIDIFARHRAELVAVADGTVVAVGTPSRTSGLRVRVRDACGWEYYYGHLDQAAVSTGQRVSAGQRIGWMGATGTSSTHLHFNVSPRGDYYADIDPFSLLASTSATACGAPAPPPPPPPPPPVAGCGRLGSGGVIAPGQVLRSCDGRFALVHQTDGNVVLYQGSAVLWHTHTAGLRTHMLAMQGDGNLVLYDGMSRPLWYSGTHGQPGASLALQDDGNLVIYRGSTAVWHTHTCCR